MRQWSGGERDFGAWVDGVSAQFLALLAPVALGFWRYFCTQYRRGSLTEGCVRSDAIWVLATPAMPVVAIQYVND